MKMINLTGRTYGQLLVLRRDGSFKNRPAWLCRCACGAETRVASANLLQGHTKTCGHRRPNVKQWTAGYKCWAQMLQRCANPKSIRFERYGGRGIKVCERWRSFDAFIADMGPRPGPEYTIERTNNDGDYEPGNCRWATRAEQMLNTSKTVRLQRSDGQIFAGYRAAAQSIGGNAKSLGTGMQAGRTRYLGVDWVRL